MELRFGCNNTRGDCFASMPAMRRIPYFVFVPVNLGTVQPAEAVQDEHHSCSEKGGPFATRETWRPVFVTRNIENR